MTTRFFCLFALALILGITGCQNPEAEALARAQNKKRPGYARLVNLTGQWVSLKSGDMNYGNLNQFDASPFKPVKAGSAKLKYVPVTPVPDANGQTIYKPTGEPTEFEIQTETNVGTTAFLHGKGQLSYLPGEPRYPEGGQNARVVFLDEQFKPVTSGASMSLTGPSGPQTFKADEPMTSISLGTWTGVKGVSEVEEKYAYTVLFLKKGSGWDAILMVNSPTDKPQATAPSAG